MITPSDGIRRVLHVLVLGMALLAAPASGQLINSLELAADAPDLSGDSHFDRLGYFSDLFYDDAHNLYYALGDRGPGGGTVSYEPRVQAFTLDVDHASGAISNFKLVRTIIFKLADGKTPFTGLAPHKDIARPGGADNTVLGRSLDSEGFVLGLADKFYVSDEYGPALYEFNSDGVMLRSFAPPANVLPRSADGRLDFGGSGKGTNPPPVVTGRQDNHGYEGLAISSDSKRLFAMLQDPLVEEGSGNQGRNSRNIRIVEYDIASGASTAQYIYQLEPVAEINSRLGPGEGFAPDAQGRGICVSALMCIGGTKFLTLERDSRGVGIDDPNGRATVGTKRVYEIDLAGATNAASISLAGTNDLPAGVVPVSKRLRLDVAAALRGAKQRIPEKMEGMAFGPKLADGSRVLLLGTDNDFSVTQKGGGPERDVYTDFTHEPLERDLNQPRRLDGVEVGPPPAGYQLIPSYLFSMKIEK